MREKWNRPMRVTLLEEHGYEVLSGKHRIPLRVTVDDFPSQPTRLISIIWPKRINNTI
ncbi:hypothetical protein [Cohnella algarum]|uniref:hypothetical protein n=1 Tax=Cohnella algarum TaxID=2044859 RepID=UPI00196784B1|nr:hypothetical protein [Cohnella algarum]MBN2979769.1 hypothetical protein [Cohnella algarum]